MNKIDELVFPDVRCYFHPDIISDHKISVCTLKRRTDKQPIHVKTMGQKRPPIKRRKLDIEQLRCDEKCIENFHNSLSHELSRSREQSGEEQGNINSRWKRLEDTVASAANETIRPIGSPPTPRRSETSKAYAVARTKLLANRKNETLKKQRDVAWAAKKKAEEQHFQEKVTRFLELSKDNNNLEKMTKTFRFIKTYRRNKASNRKYISIQKWKAKMDSLKGPPPEELPEEGNYSAG